MWRLTCNVFLARHAKLIFFNRSYFPRDPSKQWSNVGCHKNFSTEDYTICHCYHLTSYGLIMDVHGIYVRNTLIHSLFHSYFLFFTVLFFSNSWLLYWCEFISRTNWVILTKKHSSTFLWLAAVFQFSFAFFQCWDSHLQCKALKNII